MNDEQKLPLALECGAGQQLRPHKPRLAQFLLGWWTKSRTKLPQQKCSRGGRLSNWARKRREKQRETKLKLPCVISLGDCWNCFQLRINRVSYAYDDVACSWSSESIKMLLGFNCIWCLPREPSTTTLPSIPRILLAMAISWMAWLTGWVNRWCTDSAKSRWFWICIVFDVVVVVNDTVQNDALWQVVGDEWLDKERRCLLFADWAFLSEQASRSTHNSFTYARYVVYNCACCFYKY